MTRYVIPRPVQGACDACACIWSLEAFEEPNRIEEWCARDGRCPCHDPYWVLGVLEANPRREVAA